MIDEESSDEDFDFGAEQGMEKRYPVHDCCEFEDAEALKVRQPKIRWHPCCCASSPADVAEDLRSGVSFDFNPNTNSCTQSYVLCFVIANRI